MDAHCILDSGPIEISVQPPLPCLPTCSFCRKYLLARSHACSAKPIAFRLVLLQLLSALSFHLLADSKRLMHPGKISRMVFDISLEASNVVSSLFSLSTCRRALRASLVRRSRFRSGYSLVTHVNL